MKVHKCLEIRHRLEKVKEGLHIATEPLQELTAMPLTFLVNAQGGRYWKLVAIDVFVMTTTWVVTLSRMVI
jgi:hypothetical protein